MQALFEQQICELRRQALEYAVKHIPYGEDGGEKAVEVAEAFYKFLRGEQQPS